MGRRPCCSKEGVNRGAWSAQEDRVLISYIKTHGEGKWRDLPKRAGLKRCGKSCRLRWLNYLRPDIKRGNISPEEEDLIIRLHKLLGNRWSLIAGRLPCRTDNEIKNYWNTCLSKKIKGQPSKTSNQEQHLSQLQEKKPSTKTSIESPSTESEPHQVIRTKAIRCTKLFLPPQEGNWISGKDSEPSGTYKFPSMPTPQADDDSLNFLMDFDIGEIFVSDILNSDFIQAGCDENHEKRNASSGEDGSNDLSPGFDHHHLSFSEALLDDWKECNSIQDDVALELQMLDLP